MGKRSRILAHGVPLGAWLIAAGCQPTPAREPVSWTPSPGPGESWALVVPETPPDGPSGGITGRRDAALGVVAAASEYPVDEWPDARVPTFERARWVQFSRRADSYVVFRRPNGAGWWRY